MRSPSIELGAERRRLKYRLVSERSTFTADGMKPVCAVCGFPIMDGPDMHEALITRGDIRGNDELWPLIMVKQNCVLVHHGECHMKADSKEVQDRILGHLIGYEGKESILGWLSCLEVSRSNIVSVVKRKVEQHENEMHSL